MSKNVTKLEVKELAYYWFKKLTEHAPVEELIALISHDSDLLIEFPNSTITNTHEFKEWYTNVIHTFFDQQHVIQMLDIQIVDAIAYVTVIVNWQTRTWEAPNPYSKWEGYCVHQTWTVKYDTTRNRAVISTYKVGEFDSYKRVTEL